MKPWLHLSAENPHKEDWKKLLGEKYEVVEWTKDNNRRHISEFYPEIDFNIFPTYTMTLFSTFSKLYDYGGMVISEDAKPPPSSTFSIKTDSALLNPEKVETLTSIGEYKFSILLSPRANEVTLQFLNSLKEDLQKGIWRMPNCNKIPVCK